MNHAIQLNINGIFCTNHLTHSYDNILHSHNIRANTAMKRLRNNKQLAAQTLK